MVDATDHKLQLLRPVTLQLSASFASPFGSTRRVSCPSPTRHCHFSRGTRSARHLINLSAAYRSFLFKGKLIISHLGTYPTSPSLTSSHPRTKSSSIGILILAKIPPSSELHALSPFLPYLFNPIHCRAPVVQHRLPVLHVQRTPASVPLFCCMPMPVLVLMHMSLQTAPIHPDT